MFPSTVPSIYDYSSVATPVEVLEHEAWRSLTPAEFHHRYADRPVLLRDLGAESTHLDWSDVFHAIRDLPCMVNTHVLLGDRNETFYGIVPFSEFHDVVEKVPSIYIAEWYLFEQAADLLQQLSVELPPYLSDDWLSVLPAAWNFLRPPTRTTLYYGAHASQTNVHIDEMNTVTWNMCLSGTKRWLLFSCQNQSPPETNAAYQYFIQSGKRLKSTFITPEMIRARMSETTNDAPFHWVDVPAGSTLHVPWGWAHQVQNIGPSMAMSRYYVGAQNFAPFIRGASAALGGTKLLGLLLGGPRRRRALGSGWQGLLSGRPLSSVFKRALRARSPLGADHHWFRS